MQDRVRFCESGRQCEKVGPWKCMRLKECAGTLEDKPEGVYMMVWIFLLVQTRQGL